ncbi:hypothetical protein J6590_043763 [Homalodisca vitripennis]|nr:hypothetical protein J6590_043763 [Homalodisca vitripennis]
MSVTGDRIDIHNWTPGIRWTVYSWNSPGIADWRRMAVNVSGNFGELYETEDKYLSELSFLKRNTRG